MDPRGPGGVFDAIGAEQIDLDRSIFDQVLTLAVELAREGREGRKVGSLFVVGDSDRVREHSRPLILDPLAGHPPEAKRLDDPNTRETLKELAQLDGAFLISSDGVAVSACRYIDASSRGVDLPLGLGARHIAGAWVSKRTDATAVVVSESSIIRIFDDGDLISEIIPELWMLSRYNVLLKEPYREHSDRELTVLSRPG